MLPQAVMHFFDGFYVHGTGLFMGYLVGGRLVDDELVMNRTYALTLLEN